MNFTKTLALLTTAVTTTMAERIDFPFEATFAGDLVEGYRFWNLTVTESDNERTEVMVVDRDGGVVFPADLKFSIPLLQIFFRKIRAQTAINGNDAEGSVVALTKLITPTDTYQMVIYPEMDPSDLSLAADFLGYTKDKIQMMAKVWNAGASEIAEKSNSRNLKFVTIATGCNLNTFQFELSEDGREIVSVQLVKSEIIPWGLDRRGNRGKPSVLPE